MFSDGEQRESNPENDLNPIQEKAIHDPESSRDIRYVVLMELLNKNNKKYPADMPDILN